MLLEWIYKFYFIFYIFTAGFKILDFLEFFRIFEARRYPLMSKFCKFLQKNIKF